MSIKDQIEAAMKKKVYDPHNKVVRATALAAMRNLVMETPVDTGRARNNWNADINNVDASTTDAGNPNATGTEKMLYSTAFFWVVMESLKLGVSFTLNASEIVGV